MRDKNIPPLIFTVSNSPIFTKNSRQHIYWDYSGEDSQDCQSWLDKTDHLKRVDPLPKEPKIYIAEYRGGKDLKIYETKGVRQEDDDCLMTSMFIFGGPEHPMEEEDDIPLYRCAPIKTSAWDFFYKKAWLEDLSAAITTTAPDLDDEEMKSCLDFLEEIGSPTAMLKHFPERIERTFELMADRPNWVDNPILIKLHKAVHHKARYSANKKEATLMQDLLQRTFPKSAQHKGRARPIPYDRKFLLAYDLMKIWTRDLSNKCKGFLKGCERENEEYLNAFVKNEKIYSLFIQKVKDHRLNGISAQMFKRLIVSPIEGFLDPQIAVLYKCEPETFKKHIKKIKNALNPASERHAQYYNGN